jgi:hypothetical protein
MGDWGEMAQGPNAQIVFFVLLNSTNKSKKFKDIMDNNAHL